VLCRRLAGALHYPRPAVMMAFVEMADLHEVGRADWCRRRDTAGTSACRCPCQVAGQPTNVAPVLVAALLVTAGAAYSHRPRPCVPGRRSGIAPAELRRSRGGTRPQLKCSRHCRCPTRQLGSNFSKSCCGTARAARKDVAAPGRCFAGGPICPQPSRSRPGRRKRTQTNETTTEAAPTDPRPTAVRILDDRVSNSVNGKGKNRLRPDGDSRVYSLYSVERTKESNFSCRSASRPAGTVV
jgi:hypothetical protein